VYALAAGTNDTAAAAQLSPILHAQWSLATALSLLVWYIYAPQCLSTLATIKRETGSWKQVGISAGYLFGLAYIASLVTYQVAVALGAG
jgi:ferrous iron transport protein B